MLLSSWFQHDLSYLSNIGVSNADDISVGEGSSSAMTYKRHATFRQEAEHNYLASAEKIRNRSVPFTVSRLVWNWWNHSINRLIQRQPSSQRQYAIGDAVGIKIPRIDRTGLDDRVLRCKVRSRLQFGSGTVYELQSAFGVVDRKYSAASLVPQDHVVFPELESLDIAQIEGANSLSLREIAQQMAQVESSSNLRRFCMCKTQCKTKKCSCKKAKIPCSSLCHPNSKICRNHD